MTERTAPAAPVLDLDRLRSAVTGRVSAPGDPTYDADRVVMYGGLDPRPAAIVRVADTADVRGTLAFAREGGIPIAIRSGGHSGAGHSTVDGGLVIDVRDLRTLDIDVDGRTAWVGAGLTAGDITTALAAHGLAIGFGDTGSVGVAGITLGGGVGYLVRRFGLTIDSLLAAELVTADGEIRLVDEAHDPELFWGVRGGGANLGVATRFRFRLHEVDRVTGGMLVVEATPASIAAFLAAGAAAPEALSVIANVMPCPRLPFVPEASHGAPVIFGLVCWSGPADEAEAALAPLRASGPVLGDMLRPMAYPELYGPEDPDYHPLAIGRTGFLDTFDAAKAAVILERFAAIDAPMKVVQLRPLGGAMGRVPADATAFAHRERALMVNVAAFYGGPDDVDEKTAWVEALLAELRDGPAAYVNFLADEGEARVRDAYPDGAYERLAALKRRVDPDDVFRRAQHVVPAG